MSRKVTIVTPFPERDEADGEGRNEDRDEADGEESARRRTPMLRAVCEGRPK